MLTKEKRNSKEQKTRVFDYVEQKKKEPTAIPQNPETFYTTPVKRHFPVTSEIQSVPFNIKTSTNTEIKKFSSAFFYQHS